ncbi:MAG: hypothetical protein AAF570_19415, partial [Bacteroidota bacterium]
MRLQFQTLLWGMVLTTLWWGTGCSSQGKPAEASAAAAGIMSQADVAPVKVIDGKVTATVAAVGDLMCSYRQFRIAR